MAITIQAHFEELVPVFGRGRGMLQLFEKSTKKFYFVYTLCVTSPFPLQRGLIGEKTLELTN
jgi:hypothetical protein